MCETITRDTAPAVISFPMPTPGRIVRDDAKLPGAARYKRVDDPGRGPDAHEPADHDGGSVRHQVSGRGGCYAVSHVTPMVSMFA
jgi:hypothetical protein